MKNYIYFFYFCLCFFIVSCNTTHVNKRYVYIDVNKEHDLELYILKDSTFMLKDIYGCNQMLQKGKWRKMNDNKEGDFVQYLLFDTTKVTKYTNMHNKVFYSYISNVDNRKYSFREEDYFPIINVDTLTFVNNDDIFFFRGLTFKKSNKNLAKKRVKMIENQMITKIGVRMYVKTIGDGISKKRARENITSCK